MLKVLLIDDQPDRALRLRSALTASGCEVVSPLDSPFRLCERVKDCDPDVIIIDTDSPDRDTLENLGVVSRDRPRPVVMFTHDGDTKKIRAAVHAGVSAYIVNGLAMERVRPIIDVAVARFEQYQALRRELEATEEKLAERKAIERAKGILMKSRKLSEDDAYRALRKMAMDRNLRLSEVAEQIISVSRLLG